MKVPMQRRLWITYILLFAAPILFMATVGYAFLSRVMIDKSRQEYQTLLVQNASTLENDIRRLTDISNQFRRTSWIEKIINLQGNSIDPNRVSAFDLIQYRQYIIACRESSSLVYELGLYFTRKDLVIATYGNSDFDFLINNAMRVENMDIVEWQILLDGLLLGRPLIKPGVTIYKYGIAHQKLLYLERIQPVGSTQPACVVFATIRTSDINRHLEAISMNGQNNISVADTEGRIFAVAGTEIRERTMSLEYVSAFTGWKYTIQVPEGVILRELNWVRNILLMIVMALLLICGFLSFAFSKRMSNPIKELVLLMGHQSLSHDEVTHLKEGIRSLLFKQSELSNNLKQQCARLKDSYIGMILTGSGSDADFILEELDAIDISLNRPYFQVAIIIRRSTQDTPLPPLDPETLERFLEKSSGDAVGFARRTSSNCVLLFNYSSKNDLEDMCTTLLDKVPDAVLALGGETCLAKEISTSCLRAVTISRYRCFAEGYRLIRYEDHATKMGLYYYSFEKEHSFAALLASSKGAEALRLVESLMDDNMKREDVAPDGVRNLLLNIAMNIARAVSKETTFYILPVTQLAAMTVEELQAYVRQAVTALCDINPEGAGQSPLLARIKEYVDNALRDPNLSLNMVADAFGVSPSFVSKLFKEKGTKHFHQYINEQRIDLAKPLLLLDEGLTVLEVAKLVGYENDITFRRQFKQFTGITPGVYRVSV